MTLQIPLKRTTVSSSEGGQDNTLMKRRPTSVGLTHDGIENLKFPLFSEDFEQLNPECNRQNNDIFKFRDCICDGVKDLSLSCPLKNVNTVAIVGSLAYCSRLHLVKLLTQSDIRVVSNLAMANCIILGWWIEAETAMAISAKSAHLVTEEDILKTFRLEIKEKCRHIKYQKRRNVCTYDENKSGVLLKDALRPKLIAHIGGHQDAFNKFYTFVQSNATAQLATECVSHNMIFKEEKVCVLIYPPGCGVRVGVELICRALGFCCTYTECASTSDKLIDNAHIKRIHVYHMENLDTTTLEQIVKENKLAVVLVEDYDRKFIVLHKPRPGTIIPSRGTMYLNVPAWIQCTAVCIAIPPTPDSACQTLVKSLLQSILRKRHVPDVQVKRFLEMGRTDNGYVDLEKVTNNIYFHTLATRTRSDLAWADKLLEINEDIDACNTLHRYDNSLEAVESTYQAISCSRLMCDHYLDCDIEINPTIKEDICGSETVYYCLLIDRSSIALEIEKLLRNEKNMERQCRKDHLELMKHRRKMATLSLEPSESYNAHKFAFVW